MPNIPGSPGSTPGQFNNPSPTSNTGSTNLLGTPPGSLTGTSPGSTSNVTSWVPDILEMAQEACEHAGVDYTGAYQLRSVKRSLDYLAMMWANEGLNLWCLDEIQTTLTPGVASYAMPSDTMDLISPAIRTQQGFLPDGTTPRWQDILIAREDFESYLSIPNKQSPGKPNLIFVQRKAVAPQFFVWPTPNAYQPYILLWWRLRRMQNTGNPTNTMDIPWRFVPALTFGLAWQIALKKKGQKDFNLIAMLKSNYEQAFEKAMEEDRDRSSIYMAPYIQNY